ncbi:MAG: DUF45 domain-containing protein [Bacilli bacterium]|nr:DUF45 domain-containing protein [Bacilli bacterium]
MRHTTSKTIERNYLYNGVTYPAKISFKRMKNLTLRYDAEKNELRVSCPNHTYLRDIDAFVTKYLPRLLRKRKAKTPVYDGNVLYLFGLPMEVGEVTPEEIAAYYKKMGLPYVKQRVADYCSLMDIKDEYKVRLRDMKRTFGSNSRRTHTLTFQTRMMAFPKETIDSVIVHELAHHYEFNHSKAFYAIVYRYCPEYDKYRKQLIHDQFAL